MAHHDAPAPVSAESLATAQKGWKNFTRATVIGIAGVIGLLVLLVGVSALNGWM